MYSITTSTIGGSIAYNDWIITQFSGAVPALRITSNDTAPAFIVEDSTNPDTTPFTISSTGRVGIGVTPDSTTCLALDSTGVKFSDGTVQSSRAVRLNGDQLTGFYTIDSFPSGLYSGFIVSDNTIPDDAPSVQILANAITLNNNVSLQWTGILATEQQDYFRQHIRASTIVRGTALNPSGTISAQFSFIPSWARRITILLQGISTNGTNNIGFRIGSNAGDESTGYTSGCTTISSTPSNSTATDQFIIDNAVATSSVLTGSVILTNISGNTWISASQLNNAGISKVGNGSKTITGGVLDRVILWAGGNSFDAGSVNIIYEG